MLVSGRLLNKIPPRHSRIDSIAVLPFVKDFQRDFSIKLIHRERS